MARAPQAVAMTSNRKNNLFIVISHFSFKKPLLVPQQRGLGEAFAILRTVNALLCRSKDDACGSRHCGILGIGTHEGVFHILLGEVDIAT